MAQIMNVEPLVLEGKTVRLEPFEPTHAAGLAQVATPDLFTHTLRPAELSEAGFREQLMAVSRTTGWCTFAQVLVETGQAIGTTSYLDIRPEHRSLEIGFTWIARPWQQTRVNPEAKLLLLSHAFDRLGAIRVQLKTDERNQHSQAAIAKLGAVREGVLRSHMILPDGHQRNTVMFSITAREWPAVRDGLEARIAAFA